MNRLCDRPWSAPLWVSVAGAILGIDTALTVLRSPWTFAFVPLGLLVGWLVGWSMSKRAS